MATARGHGEISGSLLQHDAFAGTSFVDNFGRSVYAMQGRELPPPVSPKVKRSQVKPPSSDPQMWHSLAKWTSQLQKLHGEAGKVFEQDKNGLRGASIFNSDFDSFRMLISWVWGGWAKIGGSILLGVCQFGNPALEFGKEQRHPLVFPPHRWVDRPSMCHRHRAYHCPR